ncbi:MAG TPA: hypothetical protein VL633_07260 [Bacteroidota bacterium]|jgi:hypothetical protein|nr:hypothetical protein [Bacteroidota bacterium]
MRSIILIAFTSIILAISAFGQVQFGGAVTDQGLRNFYVSIGQYYRVPEREVIVVRDRSIPDEEIPVVFFIAQRAHVQPVEVIDLRNRGQSWMDISLHYGIGPEVYYVPATQVSGPPYGRAYGYYRQKPRRQWKTIRLSDEDVVNMVNLRFVSNQYHYSAPEVMKMRSSGKSFVVMTDEARGGKHKGGNNHDNGRRGNGRGKHKGRD